MEKKPADQEGKTKPHQRGRQFTQPLVNFLQGGMNLAADKTLRDGIQFYKMGDQIDCDRVHSDPHKRTAPVSVVLDVDHVIKESQQ